MNRKEVREWLKGRSDLKERVDVLRKDLEAKDLPGLLSMVELSESTLDKVKLLVIAEILKVGGLVRF